MARAFLIVLDSLGIGGAPDAADFGDEGANTLGHIAAHCAAGRANIGRQGPLKMPHLDALGLGGALGGGARHLARKGHALGALGIGGCACALGVDIFPRPNPCL